MMVKLKYLNYVSMSIIAIFNMLWLRLELNFADIPWQKPNITRVAVY